MKRITISCLVLVAALSASLLGGTSAVASADTNCAYGYNTAAMTCNPYPLNGDPTDNNRLCPTAKYDQYGYCMTEAEVAAEAEARRCASDVSTQRGRTLGARVLIVAQRFCGQNGKSLYAYVVRVAQYSGRVLGVRSLRVGVLRGEPSSLRARVVLLTKYQRPGRYRLRYTLRSTYRRSDPYLGENITVCRRVYKRVSATHYTWTMKCS